MFVISFRTHLTQPCRSWKPVKHAPPSKELILIKGASVLRTNVNVAWIITSSSLSNDAFAFVPAGLPAFGSYVTVLRWASITSLISLYLPNIIVCSAASRLVMSAVGHVPKFRDALGNPGLSDMDKQGLCSVIVIVWVTETRYLKRILDYAQIEA